MPERVTAASLNAMRRRANEAQNASRWARNSVDAALRWSANDVHRLCDEVERLRGMIDDIQATTRRQ